MELLHIAAGGGGTILLCPPDGSDIGDPDARATAARDVALLAPRGPTSASITKAASDIAEALDALALRSVGVVGWSTGGTVALTLVAHRPDLVVRVAIVGTPKPGPEETLAFDPSQLRTKTLLVYGGADPDAGSVHGRWWQRNLPDARLEMTPDAVDLLPERWSRILSHLAPRTTR